MVREKRDVTHLSRATHLSPLRGFFHLSHLRDYPPVAATLLVLPVAPTVL